MKQEGRGSGGKEKGRKRKEDAGLDSTSGEGVRDIAPLVPRVTRNPVEGDGRTFTKSGVPLLHLLGEKDVAGNPAGASEGLKRPLAVNEGVDVGCMGEIEGERILASDAQSVELTEVVGAVVANRGVDA